MTTLLSSRVTLRYLVTLTALLMPLSITNSVVAQESAKRTLTHDDYDTWESMSGATYSRDGKWMAYTIGPRVGDGRLYIQEVDGDKVYEFARGTRVSFSNDNNLAFYKLSKSYDEERKKKIEKLYEKKKEKEPEETEEQEGLPPDIKEALAERGIPEARALSMMEQTQSLTQMRSFLGLPEPAKKAKKPAATGKKESGDKKAKAAEKALSQRVHILNLSTGEIEKLESVKSYRKIGDSSLLAIHYEKPEPKKDKKKPAEGTQCCMSD